MCVYMFACIHKPINKLIYIFLSQILALISRKLKLIMAVTTLIIPSGNLFFFKPHKPHLICHT